MAKRTSFRAKASTLARAPGDPVSVRWNVFLSLHKAARRVLCDTLACCGSLDLYDIRDLRRALSQTRDMLAFVELQARLIDSHVGIAVPEIASALHAMALQRQAGIDAMRAICQGMEPGAEPPQTRPLQHHYGALARYVIQEMGWMLEIEALANGLLWARFDDGELRELESRMFAAIATGQLHLWLQWIVPALDPPARIRALEHVRARVPAREFREALHMLQDTLPDWAHRALMRHFLPERPIG